MSHNSTIGRIGEDEGIKFLNLHGFKILQRHVTSHWGEIDIIAEEKNKLHFVEVKTRIDTRFGLPHESVTPRKIHSLKRAIDFFLLKNKFKQYKLSLDVISIILDAEYNVLKLKFFENVQL